MAATEGLRKHSTTLFKGVPAYQQTSWSGLLNDHKNLNNHQICIVADEVLTTGAFAVYIIPDGQTLNTAVDTGLVLDMTGKDSAIVRFTGVINGLYLQAITSLTPTANISAVISSFSRYKESGGEYNQSDHRNYVSSDLASGINSGFQSLTKNTRNHANLIYHQLTMMASSPLTDQYRLRIMPDADDDLESTVDTGHILDFAGTQSVIIYFGAVLSGVSLEAISASGGAQIDVVLSSSVERYDELVYDYIGLPIELGDHLTDFNNPHQTSWDNLLNKPLTTTGYTLTKEYLEPLVELTIPDRHQYLVWESFDIEGTLTVEGKLVILGDHPDTDAKEPDFTYNLSGDLIQVDYTTGEQKAITYSSGDILYVDSTVDGETLRKNFFYTVGGDLDYITEEYV